MLLTITTTHHPATDLGYLLHKHPGRLQSVELSIGKAHIFYPESTDMCTTVALLLDIDPIDMVRGVKGRGNQHFSLGHYVNDRPYVASSYLSVALSKAFSTAMNGRCNDKPHLVDHPLPLEATLSVVSAPKGGEQLIRKLFEPLGYKVKADRHALDEAFPAWGDSKYFTLQLSHTLPLQKLLSHLYVLIPVLDTDKHYYVSKAEIDKLLDKGKGWLADHPEREQITNRYLIGLKGLSRQALQRLDEGIETTASSEEVDPQTIMRKESLHQKRLKAVTGQVLKSGAETVIDLGCGEGKLLRMLLKEKQIKKIAGMDVSHVELSKAKDRLRWEEMAPRQRQRIDLFQGALTYKDKRLAGFDAAAIVEVIEHLDEDRLQSFERVVFEFAKPKTVILTTPNGEYNVLYENMAAGAMRHNDHRFEWSRAEFENWASGVAQRNGYIASFLPIGEVDAAVGAPSQMGVFVQHKGN